jgi:hypothetical protein
MERGGLGVLISVLAVTSACSSPTTPSSANTAQATPPSASIQSAINTFLSNVTTSVNATKNGSQSLALAETAETTAPRPFGPGVTAQCTPSGSSCSVQFNESFSRQDACANGGGSAVSATLTGVLQGDASSVAGTLNMSTRTTFSDCSENGWLTNSNPSIAANGTLFLTTQHTRLNLTVSGGFVITNAPGTPAGRASCGFNGVLLQWDDITGNWANSGSVDCADGRSFRF